MDALREATERLIENENEQLARREEGVERHGYQSRIIVVGGAILLAGLLWVTSARVDRLMRAKEQLIAELAESREQETRGSAELATTLRSIGDAVVIQKAGE